MTYRQYYTSLNTAIALGQDRILSEYRSMKGYKGFLTKEQLKRYDQLTENWNVLINKSKDIFDLVMSERVKFDDEVDPAKLSFIMEQFDV